MPAIPNDLDMCEPMTLDDLILSLARVLKGNGEAEVKVCNSKLGTMALRLRKVTFDGDVCLWGDYQNP